MRDLCAVLPVLANLNRPMKKIILAFTILLTAGLSAQQGLLSLYVVSGNNALANHPVWLDKFDNNGFIVSSLRLQTNASGYLVDSLPYSYSYEFYSYDCNGNFYSRTQTVSTPSVSDTLYLSCAIPANSCQAQLALNSNTGLNLSLTDSSINVPVNAASDFIQWSWGDGHYDTTFSANSSLSHNYAQAGTYQVCIDIYRTDTANNKSVCYDSYCASYTVGNPTASCQAYFTVSGTAGTQVNFSNSSVANNFPSTSTIDYLWTFGDGDSATTINTSHSYAQNGSYNVCLYQTVRDSSGNVICSSDTCMPIQYSGAPISASCGARFEYFWGGGRDIKFLPFRSVNPQPDSIFYSWTFGDGSPAQIVRTPLHTYASNGNYSVCMTMVALDSIQDTICVTNFCDTVQLGGINSCPPYFTATPDSANALKYVLTDSSSLTVGPGEVKKVLWHIEDGGNGIHFFSMSGWNSHGSIIQSWNAPGTYNVCLYVMVEDTVNGTISCGGVYCDSLSVNFNPFCVTTLNSTADSLPLRYNFQASVMTGGGIMIDSSNNVFSFGDGTTAVFNGVGNSTTHTYLAAGTYVVCAQSNFYFQGNLSCSSVDCDTITVGSTPGPFCKADFIVDTVNSYQNNVYVWNMADPAYSDPAYGSAHTWYFGDGDSSNTPFPVHTYAGPGTYTLCLKIEVTDSLGNFCSDMHCDTIGVDSLGNLQYKSWSGPFVLNVLDTTTIGLTEVRLPEVAVYPNPSSGRLAVEYSDALQGAINYQVYDIKGALLRNAKMTLSAGKGSLDLSTLQNGLYILTLDDGAGTISQHRLQVIR